MAPTFVDTNAFVALADRRDRNHAKAKRMLKALAKAQTPLVTSTDVADEVITLVRRRLGHPAAVTAGEALLRSRWRRLLDIDAAMREAAWSIFVRFDDKSSHLRTAPRSR